MRVRAFAPDQAGHGAELRAPQLFTVEEALTKILPGQSGFVRELKARPKL
jgi:predicted NUDIX family NTP pyrophosphohydrolase